jgi:organic radical activating enzyme
MLPTLAKYPISQIFLSIQGEGYHTGTRAVFVRLAGCNFHCPWCDTDFTPKSIMTAKEIGQHVAALLAEVGPGDGDMVVITGGEPTIHNLTPLLDTLLDVSSFYICIETNGSRPDELERIEDKVNWVTCSPKNHEYYNAAVKGHREKEHDKVQRSIDLANEVKMIFSEDINPYAFELSRHFEGGTAYIQPCSQNYAPAVAFVMANPQWRLSIQLHKVIHME